MTSSFHKTLKTIFYPFVSWQNAPHLHITDVVTGMGIFTLGLLLRLYKLGTNNLQFDEGAAWFIGHVYSVPQLLRGEYYDAGWLPGIYVLTKIIPAYASEFSFRALPALLGSISILFVYFTIRLFSKPSVAAVTSLLLAVLPAHIFYSRELLPYAPGFFFQSASLYYFLRHFRELHPKHSVFVFWVCTTICGLIFTHSTAFLLLFYLLFSYIHFSKDRERARVAIFWSLYLVVPALFWIFWYGSSNHGQLAMHNYVGYWDRNFLSSLTTLIGDIVYFFPFWIAKDPEPLNLTLLPILLLIFSSIIIHAYQYIKQKRSATFMLQGNRWHFFPTMVLLACCILIPAVLFSFIKFNVISLRLLFPIVIPALYVLVRITTVPVTKNGTSIPLMLFIVPFLLYNSMSVVSAQTHTISTLLSTARSHMKSSHRQCYVVSAEQARGMIFYYTPQLIVSTNEGGIYTINYNDPADIPKTVQKLRNAIDAEVCQYIVFIQYFDIWSILAPDSYYAFNTLLSRYHTLYKDSSNARASIVYVTVYEKTGHETEWDH